MFQQKFLWFWNIRRQYFLISSSQNSKNFSMTLFLSFIKDTQYASELDESCMTYSVNVIRDDRDLKPYENIISFMDQIKSRILR